MVQVNQSEVLVFVKSVLSFWFMCNQFKVFGSSVANLRFWFKVSNLRFLFLLNQFKLLVQVWPILDFGFWWQIVWWQLVGDNPTRATAARCWEKCSPATSPHHQLRERGFVNPPCCWDQRNSSDKIWPSLERPRGCLQ